ncbi:short chain dehydrogenase [Aliamphritea ceti]|uniref:short chain dehydrogenase n=1 Tax=Aliamphritea ceti TaxID=1524258 RepID=UPI0021C49071|nr:short chain dehydrogenase [Aliamphritea ceti]
MKILLIGATGTIGKAVADKLAAEHQIIRAGYSDGDVRVDLGNSDNIRSMFKTTGKVDAIISTAGLASFAPLQQLQDSDYQLALNNKLMGQINLIRIGSEYVSDGGSVTLTSGVLSKEPIPGSASIAMANGALESFVLAAALEETRINLNVVAPAFVKETMEMMGMDSSTGISAADTASAYAEALNSHHGETLDVRDHI